MKKVILTSFCTLTAIAAFAQGTVNWNSITPTVMAAVTNSTVVSITTPTGQLNPSYTTTGVTTTTASSYYFELLYNTSATAQPAPSTVSALQGWSDTGLEAVNGTSGGGRLLNLNGSLTATVPWVNGVSDSILLVGWSANLGTSWSAASALVENWTTADQTTYGLSFFGVSAAGYLTPNTSPATGAPIFGTPNANGTSIYNPSSAPMELNELVVTSTPEPGTLALAALGGASLLLFRRKK